MTGNPNDRANRDNRNDDHDLLDALRRADPVDVSTVPGPHSAPARALVEEITAMDPSVPAPTPEIPARRPRPALVTASAAILLVLAGGVFALARGGNETPEAAPATTVPPATTGPPTVSGSCVEVYSLETLANRGVAFDGTVTAIDGNRVTFAVESWFKGGSGGSVTLEADLLVGAPVNSVNPEGFTVAVGERYLVGGEDGFAWACGFTQVYDAEVAADWQAALAG